MRANGASLGPDRILPVGPGVFRKWVKAYEQHLLSFEFQFFGAHDFTGMSSYSQDLNNAISQEVQIASLPIQLLENNVNDMTNQSDELQTLDSDVSSVQSAVSGLVSAAGNMLFGEFFRPSVASVI